MVYHVSYVLYKQPLNNCQLSGSIKSCMGSEHLPHPAKNPHVIYSLETRNNWSRVPFYESARKVKASVLAVSKFRWAQNRNLNQNNLLSQWMNFSWLIKSQFKSGGEIVAPLHWMDMLPQILVACSPTFTNQLSVAWKHPQIARHNLSTYVLEDCQWKMVCFPTQIVGFYSV